MKVRLAYGKVRPPACPSLPNIGSTVTSIRITTAFFLGFCEALWTAQPPLPLKLTEDVDSWVGFVKISVAFRNLPMKTGSENWFIEEWKSNVGG